MPASVAQVLTGDGSVAGAGFLVGEDIAVTCAHVVCAAGQGPGGRVELAFPHLPDAPRVWGCVLAGQWRAPEAEDIAVVKLESVPAGARELALGSGTGCRGHRVSSFGFPVQAPPGGHYGYGKAGDLLPDDRGTGTLLQLSEANDLTTGFSGGPVVDQATGLVIGMVTSITSPDPHLKGLGIAYCTPAEVLRELWPELAEHKVCPYRRLEPFTAEHAGWFHGREAAVESVLAALGRQRRMLLLLGPSGAGKSSLVQAGVLPALAAGAVSGSDRWLPLLARPGQELLAELERAGLPGAATDGILPAVERLLDGEPDCHRLVVVIDQFEELLTQPAPADTRPPDRRVAAVDELLTVINSHAAASVILIMRDDFYPRLAAFAPGLLEAAAPGLLNVPATLSIPELHAIITRPAQAVGARIEDGLPERIITDVLAADSARRAPVTLLPPLELALSQLWDRRDDGQLTHRAYQQIGEVTGSLATWCNTAVNQLPTDHRLTAQRILTALVRPADESYAIPATRQQVPLARLRALATDPKAAGPAADSVFEHVLAALTRYRIITTGTATQPGDAPREPTAELIHDALIRDWSDLRDWVAQDHRFQVWLHHVAEQQARYATSGLPGDLLGGTVLAAAMDWARQRSLPTEITAFVTASQHHQQAAVRRTRRINTVLAGILALALIAAGVAFWQRQSAITAQSTAVAAQHEAQSRQLAAQSDALIDTNPDLASLLAIQAHRTSPTDEATASLYAAAALPLQYRFTGHTGPVFSVAFSPDGKTLATGSDDGTARLWDVASGKPLGTLTDYDGPVVFSPDGKTLATGSRDGTVRLWDVASGKLLDRLVDHTDPVFSVGFSPDGKTLATGGTRGTVRLWDVASRKPRNTITSHTGLVFSVGFSPDGKTLATSSGDGNSTVRLWDVASRKPRNTITSHTGRVHSAVFSPGGKTLATASDDGTVRLWDVASGKLLDTLVDDTGPMHSVGFSPDGKTLATGGTRGTVRLWDVASRKPRNTLIGHTGSVSAVVFSPGGKTLATGSADGTVRLWDVASDQPRSTITNQSGPVVFSPDGRILATGSGDVDGTVRLWDAASGKPRKTIISHTGSVSAVVFSPGDKTLATGSEDGTVRLWDVASGKPRSTITNHDGPVVFSPDGRILATSSGDVDGTVRLWDAASGKPRKTIISHTGPLSTVVFSPGGKTLATSSGDETVRLWDVTSGEPRSTITNHTSRVHSVVFSPDGKTLVTGSEDGTVRLWDVASGKPRITLTGHTGLVSAVAFSPDGKTLVTGSEDHTVRLWDAASGKPRITLTGHTSRVHSAVFSPDGKTLATSSEDQTVRLWDVVLPDAYEASRHICRALHRTFTSDERTSYLRGQAPAPVCPAQRATESARTVTRSNNS